MRGIYEGDEGSSLLRKWSPVGIEVDKVAFALAVERV